MIVTSSPFLKPGWTTLLRIWRWKFQATMYIALIAMKRLVVAFVHMFENLMRLDIYMTFISSAGFHQLWLQVQVGRCKSIVICTVYRPPNSDLNCFDAEFMDPQDHGSLAVLNFCSIFNLTQVIKQPTRITETSETLIDVILASSTSLIRGAKVVPAPFSDHDLVFISPG